VTGFGGGRFAVIPLTEETGIIEWVPHTHGLRHCCQDIYIADGTYDKRTVNMTVKKIYDGFQVKSDQAGASMAHIAGKCTLNEIPPQHCISHP